LPGSPNISQPERVNKSARCRGEELLAAIMGTAIIDRTTHERSFISYPSETTRGSGALNRRIGEAGGNMKFHVAAQVYSFI